jgi:2'-5' RNA ligase
VLDPTLYDRFSVVAFATPELLDAVETVRRALPPSGRPILPGHVTIKGTWIDPTDLDEMAARIRRCCAEARPFTLTSSALHIWPPEGGEHASVVVEMRADDEGVRLHWQLVEELAGLATTIYYGEDVGVYTPHLTIVQEIAPEQAEAALPVIERLLPPFSFTATEAALVGRRGGVAWETLTTFPLDMTPSSE